MKSSRKHTRTAAWVLAAVAGVAVSARGTDTYFADVQIIGSTTPSATASGYTSNLTIAPGTTVYYAVQVEMNTPPATNHGKTLTTLDAGKAGVTSLSYNLSDSTAAFGNDVALQPFFNDNGQSGAIATDSHSITNIIGSINGTISGHIPAGASNGSPAWSLVQTGSLAPGSTGSTVSATYGTTSGGIKINNGSAVSGNALSVASGDPNGYFKFEPLTITVQATHTIISLTSSAPTGYGASSLGTLQVHGSHAGGYAPASLTITPTATGYVQETGIDVADAEYFGLELLNVGADGSGKGLNDIITAINTANLGVTASTVSGSPFASLSGFSNDNLLLSVAAGSQNNPQFLGFDLSSFSGVTVGELDAVPEPASFSIFAIGGLALLQRRRRVSAQKGATA